MAYRSSTASNPGPLQVVLTLSGAERDKLTLEATRARLSRTEWVINLVREALAVLPAATSEQISAGARTDRRRLRLEERAVAVRERRAELAAKKASGALKAERLQALAVKRNEGWIYRATKTLLDPKTEPELRAYTEREWRQIDVECGGHWGEPPRPVGAEEVARPPRVIVTRAAGPEFDIPATDEEPA